VLTYLRFRWQRTWRRWLRRLRGRRVRLIHTLRIEVFAKWRQLRLIRRFAAVWWLLILVCGAGLLLQTRHQLAAGTYLTTAAGGSYAEAVLDAPKTINPILPDNAASADAVRLIFNGLTRFDTNGVLQPDLATAWTISPDGKTYSFKLRHGVRWHDGVPFTSQDVAFTVTAIQNPDTRSPLRPNWQGVTVTTPDDYTIVFILNKPYTPFINATTTGLLPRHLLENVEPKSMRVAPFNQKPVGTGPFQYDHGDATAGELVLKANAAYYGGRPLIDSFILRSYGDWNEAYEAYGHRQVMGVAKLQPNQLSNASKSGTMKVYEAGVPDQVGVFFHTTAGVMSEKAVRTALSEATDRRSIIGKQFDGQANALSGPLVSSSVNLTGAPRQAATNLAKANADLEAAGWTKGSDGWRHKNGQTLTIKMVTQTGTAYVGVAHQLVEQWAKVGAQVEVQDVDVATLQQSYIRPRHYDALLYGINVGADPDVYTYWHSSQANDTGLNLSSYSSTVADRALEAGRTLRDPQTRAAKYKSFIQAWVNDSPAVMLYTPSYEYGMSKSVRGVHIRRLITPSDRFSDVQHWAVRVKGVIRHQ
jgi:peptide/nickel transport system substrate-binding protein